jgi:hypothetical protein
LTLLPFIIALHDKYLKSITDNFNDHQVYIPIQENKSKGIGFIISKKIKTISFETPFINRLSILTIQIDKVKIDIVNTKL